MALNKNRLNRSRQESTSGGGGSFMKLKNGKTNLRVYTFKHKVTKLDIELGRFNSSRDGIEAGETSEELERMVPVHFRDNVGVNCLGAKCSFCDEANEYAGSDDKTDKKTYRALRARKTFFVNCINTDAPEAGMQILGLPPSVFNVILSYVMDPEYGEGILGPNGRDFIITKDTSQDPVNMYDVKLRDEKRSIELDDELESQDLYDVGALEPGWSTNESLKSGDTASAKSKRAPAQEAEDEPGDAPQPKKGGKDNPFQDKGKGSNKPKADDEDFPWDEDDKPASRKKGKPEAEDEPEEAPAQRKKGKKPELPDFVEKGEKCSFKNSDGEIETGVVTNIFVDKGKIEIETDDSFWTFGYDEAIKPVKDKPRRNK